MIRVEKVRKEAPARKRVSCLRERGEVMDDAGGLDIEVAGEEASGDSIERRVSR